MLKAPEDWTRAMVRRELRERVRSDSGNQNSVASE